MPGGFAKKCFGEARSFETLMTSRDFPACAVGAVNLSSISIHWHDTALLLVDDNETRLHNNSGERWPDRKSCRSCAPSLYVVTNSRHVSTDTGFAAGLANGTKGIVYSSIERREP